jgi:dolichyl-phosphate beta-glucosyltransferase
MVFPKTDVSDEVERIGSCMHNCCDDDVIELSIVIPAFNEASRLPAFLTEARKYLDNSDLRKYEVIVVDDGSCDKTSAIVACQMANWQQLWLLRHPKNRGKGAAVRNGILSSSGLNVLYADADGSANLSQECYLREAIMRGSDLAVGSRLVSRDNAVVSRQKIRSCLGRVFAILARARFQLPVLDPQCGFKMFRREAGYRLFSVCHEDGYLFELQVLAVAHRYGYSIAEVGIEWQDKPGSKIHLIRDGWRMITGLGRVMNSVETLIDQRVAAGDASPFSLEIPSS